MHNRHFQDWITLVVGVWLIASPFVLGVVAPEGMTTTLMMLNFVISGAVAVALGVATLFYFRQWEEWLDVALGAWLVASPWVLGFTFSQVAVWNAVLCGVVIAAMGAWTTYDVYQEHAV